MKSSEHILVLLVEIGIGFSNPPPLINDFRTYYLQVRALLISKNENGF